MNHYAGYEPPHRNNNALTDELRSEMVCGWANGASSEVLAEIYGVHPAYVRKAAARAGVFKGRKRWKLQPRHA